MAKNRKRSTIIAELREKANAPQAQRGSDIEREKQNSSREEILADLRNVAAGGKPGANKINEAYAEYRQKKEQARADRYQSLVRDTQSLFDGNGRLNSGVTTQQLGQLSQRTREIYKERTESNAKFLKDLDSYLQRLAAGQLASGMTSKLLPQEQRDALRDQIAGQAPWDRTVTRRRSGAGTTTTGSPTGDAGGGAAGVPLLSQYKRAESGAEAQILQNTARIAELERRAQAWGAMQGGTGDREAQAEILRLEDQNRQLEAQKKAYRRAGETERLRQEMPERPEAYTPENAAQYLARGKYLASKDAWTEEDRAEARELQAALVQPVWADSAVKHAEAGDILDIQQVAEDLQTRLNATGDARLLGLPGETGEALDRFISKDLGEMTALGQGLIRGTGAHSLARGIFAGNEDTQAQMDRGDRQYEFLMQNGGTGVQASGFVGNTLGSVAGMTAAAGAADVVLGAVPGFVSLSPGLQAAAKTAAAFMTQDAVSNLGAEMTGEMTMDEYMGGIVRSGLAGMVGQGASNAVMGTVGRVAEGIETTGLAKILANRKLMTPFMEYVRQLSGATAFTAAKTGTELALTEEQELPSGEQLAQQLTAAFLFSALNSAISTAEITRENKAYLEEVAGKLQNGMNEIIQAGTKAGASQENINVRLVQYSREVQSALDALESQYIPGGQAYVDALRDQAVQLRNWAGSYLTAAPEQLNGGMDAGTVYRGTVYAGPVTPEAGAGGMPPVSAEAGSISRNVSTGQAAQTEGPGAQEIAQQLQQAVQQGVRDQANRQEAGALYQQYGETAGAAAAQQNEDLAAELQREYGPVYRQNRALEAQEAAAQKSAAPANRSGTEAPAAPRQAAQEPTNGAERQTTSRTGKSGGAARQAAETGTAAKKAPAAQERKRTGYVQPAGGTPVQGTDIVRVEQAGDGGLTLLRADGRTAALSDVKTAGTALEVLRTAEELPEYKDPLTLNGMLRAYEGYLGGGQSTPARAEDFLDSYAIALTAGAEGESRSVLAGITEDGRLRSAMETGYRRGAELSKGKRLAQHLGSAGAAALEEHGYRYPEEFGAFYQAGQEGLSFPEAKRMAGVSGLGEVRKAVFTAAWEAGRKDGNDYEETSGYDLGFEDGSRYAVSDDGGQRASGVGARGQAGAVEEGAGGSESREGGRLRNRGAGHEGARTDLKKLGVASGTDAAQRVVRRERHDYGGEVITVSDRLEVYGADGKKTTVQAISTGKDVILREGDPMYGQHRLHELEHVRQRSMTDEEITAAFKEKTKDLPDGKVRSILRAYALDYYGLYGEDSTTMGDLYREYLADRAAGIPQKETDKAVRLPDERNTAKDQRRDIYAMRGNQKPAYEEWDIQNALYDAMDHADRRRENLIRVGEMPRFVTGLTGIEGDFYLYRNHIYENMATAAEAKQAGRFDKNAHYHGLGIEKMTDAIQSLEHPIMTIATKTKDGNPAVIMLLPVKGSNGAPLYGVLSFYSNKAINGDMSRRPHVVLTIAERNFTEAGGRMGIKDVVAQAIREKTVISYDKKMKDDLPLTADTVGIGSITEPSLKENVARFRKEIKGFKEKNKINYSVSTPERDSAGRELSAEQAEYFKDSKVRDKDGNLLVMYHQTDGAFTVFDTKHDGAGARDNETPFGIFLKTTDRDIGVRGKNQMALYANITNPLHAENRADLVRQLRRLSPEYDRLKTESGKLDAEYGKKHEAAKKAFVDFLVQWRRDNPTASRSAIYDDPEFNAVYDAEDNVVTEWQERQTALDTQAKEAITEALRKNGYDGVILARDAGSFGRSTDAYIALDANQVKNPDNLAPTENPDIRYSVSEEAEPSSSAEYAQMQRGRAPAGPSEREAAEQRKRQVTLLSHMTERAFELRRQFTEGTQRDLRATDIPDVASDLLRFAGRKAMGRGELEQRLSDIAMKAARSQNPMEAYQVAKEEADYLAADMMRNATGQTDEAKDMWDGIRQTLRSGGKPVKLAITGQSRADLEREGGYEHLRKRLMGYAFLSAGGTPVDVFYEQELTPRFPTAFPDTIQNPADQLIRIVEVLDRFRQIFKSPWAGDAAEDTELLSQEILQRLYNANVQAPSAEAYAAQREEMLQAHYEQRIAETRQRMQTEMENLRRSFDEKRQGERTARQEQKDRDALLHLAQRLDRVKVGSQWKAKAAELVGNLDTIAKSMTGRTIIGDRIGNLSADGIETVGEDDLGRKYVDLETLRDWVREMQAQNPDFMPDRRTMEKIGRLDKVQIADMDIGDVRALLNAMQNLENEMRTSRKLIDAQDKRDVAVQTAETVSDIESARGVRPVGVKKAWSDLIVTEGLSPVRFLHRVTGYNDEDPLYRAGQALQKGETKMHDYARRAEAMFRGFMEDKAFMGSLAGPKARTIEVTGLGANGTKETVKITPDMQIAIFLHSFNNDNVRHAERGGFVVPDYDLLRKGHVSEAYNQGTLLRLRRSQMRAVQQNMTEREVQFARAIYRYFNTMSKDEINEVSRKLLGYDIAGVPNYYPIETNRKFRGGQPETVKRDGTIEGMGFTKERQGASGPINLRGAVDTLTKSIERHSKYVGMAIPVRNFGKLYGNSSWAIKPTEEEGATAAQQLTAQSIKWVLERKWGEEASRYIDKLMGDIQNPSRNLDSWARNMAKIRSSYAGSVLTMNASVAVKQAASYPTAAAVVGWQPLIKAMTNWEKSDINFIAEHTPLLWYRSKGFSTQELGDMAKGKKQIPKGLNWIQGIDVATVKKLWKAAEYYVRQEQPELELRSDAYWDAVTEIYERIVLETQPDYTTMERPQLLRSENTLMQNLAMFKTQPFQNFNIAYDALANLQAKERQLKTAQDEAHRFDSEETRERVRKAKENLKKAKRGASWAVSALIVSAKVFSAMTLVWNLFKGNIKRYSKDGKDNEYSWEAVGRAFLSKTFWSDTAGSLAGILPFGSDAYEVFASLVLGDRYYGMEALTPSAISDFLEELVKLDDTVKDLFKVFKGDAPVMDTVQTANRLVTTASKLFGAPIENVENIGKAVSFWAMKPFMSKEEADYWYRYYTQKTTAQGRSSADKDDIYAAYRSGNTDGYRSMRDAMEKWVWQENEKYQSGEITRKEAQEKAAERMDGAMRDRIKEDLLGGGIDRKTAEKLLRTIGGQDEEKARESVDAWLYRDKSGNQDASAAQAGAYYAFAEPAGLSTEVFAEAWDFKQNVEGDKDSSGKTVPGSAKQKVVDYIQGLGLGRDQEKALWDALKGNWKDTDTPWE